MKSKAKVVVIGGGIAGCSTAYHLAENGWNTVLIERDILNEKIGNLCSILLKKEELKTSNEETIENRESNIKVSSAS